MENLYLPSRITYLLHQKGSQKMPQIDLRTTCPFCHGEVSRLSPDDPFSYRYCIGDCETYTSWNIDGSQFMGCYKGNIIIGYLYIKVEQDASD